MMYSYNQKHLVYFHDDDTDAEEPRFYTIIIAVFLRVCVYRQIRIEISARCYYKP